MSTNATSVEDVQDCFDKLVLSIFEAVRSHADSTFEANIDSATLNPKIISIKENYEKVKQSIDNLKSLENSKVVTSSADEMTNKCQFTELNEKYSVLRSEILLNEKSLHDMLEKIDSELLTDLADESLRTTEN